MNLLELKHQDTGKWIPVSPIEEISKAKEFVKKTPIKAIQMGCDFRVQTLEGTMEARAGDWLACGVRGELYPIAKDIFERTYVPLDMRKT